MASSLPNFPSLIKPSYKRSSTQAFQVRAQRFRDEGRWNNIVDANLSVLRERIEGVKIKERLERCCKHESGWNYAPGYNYKLKKKMKLAQLVDLVGLVCGTIGWTCLSGTIFLCLFSLVVHLNQ